MANTTGPEIINGNTYEVTRDAQGNILSMVAISPPPTLGTNLTKFQYRSLFTMAEKIAIDNYAANPALTAAQIAQMRTLQFDFQIADVITLNNPATIAGTQLLETFGLIGVGRAAQILANQPPV